MQVSHGAIQFMVYEELKRLLSKNAADSQRQTLTSLEITLVGAASKLFATLSTYPLSVRGLKSAGLPDMWIHCRSITIDMRAEKIIIDMIWHLARELKNCGYIPSTSNK